MLILFIALEPLLYGRYFKRSFSHDLHSPSLRRSVLRGYFYRWLLLKHIFSLRSFFHSSCLLSVLKKKILVFVMDKRTIKIEMMIHKLPRPLCFSCFAFKRKGKFPNKSFCDRSSATTNSQLVRNRHELIPCPTDRGQDQSFQFLSVHYARHNPVGLGQGKYDVRLHSIFGKFVCAFTVQIITAELKQKMCMNKCYIVDKALKKKNERFLRIQMMILIVKKKMAWQIKKKNCRSNQ